MFPRYLVVSLLSLSLLCVPTRGVERREEELPVVVMLIDTTPPRILTRGVCALALVAAALVGSAFTTAWYARASNATVGIRPLLSVPVLDSEHLLTGSAVITHFDRYFILEDGTVAHERGYVLPGSEDTIEVASFQGALLRLDKKGTLSLYSPVNVGWIPLIEGGIVSFRATDHLIVALDREGNLRKCFLPENHGVKWSREQASPTFGGESIQFETITDGTISRVSLLQPPGEERNRPAGVIATGEGDSVFTFGNNGLKLHKFKLKQDPST